MTYLPELGTRLAAREYRVQRQASRDIVDAQTYGAVSSARGSARIDAIGRVTETALMATAEISALESLMVARTPHAETRLKHIADAGCSGMANVVLGMSRWL